MDKDHIAVGVTLLGLTLGFLAVKYFHAPGRRRLGLTGWLGTAIILGVEVLLAFHTPIATLFFTPIVWTGYLLLVGDLVRSLSSAPSAKAADSQTALPYSKWLAFWSVPLWLVFEAYNLRLRNWTYVGLPANPLVRGIGYVWAFATIWPAIVVTAHFLRALGLFRKSAAARHRHKTSTIAAIFLTGLVFLLSPVLAPVRVGAYLFGLVWIGFVLLLDPLNYWWKGRSLLCEWEAGDSSTLLSFLAAGWVCGILWEFWNFWSVARWLYIFPILQDWKVFEMPILGYVGFLPFAVECFVMYEFLCVVGARLAEFGRRLTRRAPPLDSAGFSVPDSDS
ncbi:MAG: hypothetical protein ACLQOO_25200 [Terriglobia bacterium]